MIRNRDEILSYGDVDAKRAAMEIVEKAIERADPYRIVLESVKVEGDELVVNGERFKLGNVYVVAIGKGACPMAKAIEDVLGERIAGGVVVTKYGYSMKLGIEVIEAGHPVPDENSLKAAEKALEIARSAGKDDLLIVLISGGGSSLFVMPDDDITLEEKIETYKLLLESGARIQEVNTVRKHISRVKGGKFVKGLKCKVLGLIISDVVGDDLGSIASGITVEDGTTFKDAYEILKRYSLLEKVPESVRRHIEEGMKGKREETLKRLPENVKNFLICSSGRVCEFAAEASESLGLKPYIMTSSLEGYAESAGLFIGSIVREICANGRPFERGVALIFGGETTVKLEEPHGLGGPNQELALSASRKISGMRGCCIISVDTDGTDGPTDAAGGIVDSYTLEMLEKEGIDVYDALSRHDSYNALKAVKSLVYTGPTRTNVNSLAVAVIVK